LFARFVDLFKRHGHELQRGRGLAADGTLRQHTTLRDRGAALWFGVKETRGGARLS
jgi:hypothetical protein